MIKHTLIALGLIAHIAHAAERDDNRLMLNIIMSRTLPNIVVSLTDTCDSSAMQVNDPIYLQNEQPYEQYPTAFNSSLESYCIPVQSYSRMTIQQEGSDCYGFEMPVFSTTALSAGQTVVLPTCGSDMMGIAFGSLLLKTNMHGFSIGKQYAKGEGIDFLTISKSVEGNQLPFYGAAYRLDVSDWNNSNSER